MIKFLIALMFTLQISGQILKPDLEVTRHITTATLQLNAKFFNVPSFQQPIVLIKYSPLYPLIAGITRKISADFYIIDLNPIYDDIVLEKVLIHEIVHVKQMWCGDLSKTRIGFLWKGLIYPFSTPYEIRPWEIDAENEVKLICD
jgi:hypothetical protein